MSPWKRFRNFPRWAQILIWVAVMSVGVAGASSQGPKPSEQAGRTTDTTATTVSIASAPEDQTFPPGDATAESTATTAGGTPTTAATGSTATTSPRPTTTTKRTATTTTTRPAPAGDPTAVL